ncbi:NAD(P)/FAD-dependent oxidoreductase [Oscillochloris sp. ZM17-4]|uniref:phytoene desaturase family protein n=1 Tax=Oscillochloris sp. ZM17-4 TaxID=2866714 RepID=UPI002107C78E|nr:phytoene desaturase family protein [Oscillochloris sp. ZM17-4]
MNDQTIIVGAGLGGLAAAIRLAAAGYPVTLLEKNDRVGGKLNLVQEQGYTFDTGPSLLTMPWVIRELFTAAGRRMEDYLSLDQIEPTCRYLWPDGTRFDAWQRLPQLIQEIERVSPGDVPGFFRFLAHTAGIYDAVADNFLLKPFDGISELITPRLLRDGPRIDALRNVDAAVRAHFRSPYLRQIFNRYATYNGSSPYLSPATFNVIAYIEMAEGGWYVRGGMYELGRSLLRLAEELGVQVRTGAAVAEVLLEGGAARGVHLSCGERIPAARVIVNADPRYAYAALLPGQRRTAARLARLEPSCSGYVLFLGVDHTYPQLAHHNIFFSADYPREFQAIFQKGVPAVDPTVYVAATCLGDPQHAPPGHMNLFVLVNAPALGPRVRWGRESAPYRDLVLAKLERMGLSDLRSHIVYEQIWTPADIQDRYNAAGGAIYGLASNNPFSAFMRPPLRAHGLRDLYFVGGGTHPGGGIPLVLLSGKAITERVVADAPRNTLHI